MNRSFSADWGGAEAAVGAWGRDTTLLGGGSGRREDRAWPVQGELEGIKHGWSAGYALGRAVEVNS